MNKSTNQFLIVKSVTAMSLAVAVFLYAGSALALDVSAATSEQTERIASGLERGFTIRHAYTAKSQAHQNAYFVAAELVGPGANGQVAVWLHLRTPDNPGLLMSVDGYSKEFSDWPDASQTRAAATMNDPPARDLQRHVQRIVGR